MKSTLALCVLVASIGVHWPTGRADFSFDDRDFVESNASIRTFPAALAAFLKQPNKHYKWIRMPTFGLSDKEVGLLQAFIQSKSKNNPELFVVNDSLLFFKTI